jgi:hypothetical protein
MRFSHRASLSHTFELISAIAGWDQGCGRGGSWAFEGVRYCPPDRCAAPPSYLARFLLPCPLYIVCLPSFLKHPSPLAPSEAHCHCPHGRGGDYLNLEKIQQSGAISSTCRLWSKHPHITNSARLRRRSGGGVHRALRGNGRAPRPPLRRLPPLTLQGGGRLQ